VAKSEAARPAAAKSAGANIGLVLTGGGARAAYQVGALRAIAEITRAAACPFNILVGVSAGAINSVSVGMRADDFTGAVEALTATWRSLTPDRVYRTDVRSLARIGSRWARDLTSGGLFGSTGINHLLDTTPLYELLEERLTLDRLPEHIRAGRLHGVAVSATNYLTGTAVTFFDGDPIIEPWTRSMRVGRREALRVAHVMASSSIPVFFPPIRVGNAFFGDGCVRLTAPLSPAVHMGADRIVAIGIRYARPADQTRELNRTAFERALPPAEIAGVLLNAIFLDSLESDLERLERVNRTVGHLSAEEQRRYELRRIPVLALRPSLDLGRLAAHQYDRFPLSLRFLLKGIGAAGGRGWDLLSYLAFEPVYVGMLMELGYRDTLARSDEVRAFFTTPSAEDVVDASGLEAVKE
jgi:NTE family protein